MRVLMVSDGLWNGGAERQMALLVSSLPEPWSASVLSMEDGPYRQVLEDLGVDVMVVPRRHRFDIASAIRMWRAASTFDPDVVHSWGWMSTFAMFPFCRARGIPLLNGTIRQGRIPPRGALTFKVGLWLSDAVVANSRAGLAAYGIAEGGRSRVVYNGFDPRRLHAAADAARHAAPREGTVAVMAARMYPEKDWRSFVRAARILDGEAHSWTFVAVGDGPERDDLVGESADLIERGVMEFPTGRLEVLPIVAAADIGVLLTDPRIAAEGCSNSILEYMACALPVICTDSGGNPETVDDGVTGLVVAPGDTEALLSALRTLRGDPERAMEMGRKGRQRLEERFTVSAMAAGFVAAYESSLRGVRPDRLTSAQPKAGSGSR